MRIKEQVLVFNFIVSASLKGDSRYAFLGWWDWKGIGEKHNIEHLTKNYTIKTDRKTQIILLKKR